ncbi:GNAT family N-acetyltransferase [Streptacidiphilus cavernicola]|uniref:GNAT family N-acetyltransferase n=1 Tax=Streptacidiphilus cavernicola TaxID=3342716 RepID=A0ABV6W3I7_9ACTN
MATTTHRPVVRLYQPGDRAAMDDVCARTADAGGDSRETFPDLQLLSSIFAAPYAVLEPELAFVLDDGERAVGYIVGTADTPAFVKRFRGEWLPAVADRYPAPTTEPTAEPVTPSEGMVRLMHWPERMLVPELAAYPAHLHIDLLPEHQRSGHGRELMAAFLNALSERGVPAVHLGMLSSNTPARAFYDRLGFHEIDVPDAGEITYLGRSTEFTGSGYSSGLQ